MQCHVFLRPGRKTRVPYSDPATRYILTLMFPNSDFINLYFDYCIVKEMNSIDSSAGVTTLRCSFTFAGHFTIPNISPTSVPYTGGIRFSQTTLFSHVFPFLFSLFFAQTLLHPPTKSK